MSLVDVGERTVTAEWSFTDDVVDVDLLKRVQTHHPDPQLLVLQKREICLTSLKSERMLIAQRVQLSGLPAELAVANSGGEVAVSSVWSRCVWLFEVEEKSVLPPSTDTHLRLAAQVDLPFEPRCLAYSPDGRYLIAVDAFGGRLAAIDPLSAELIALGDFQGHNAGGIQFLNQNRFLVTHQILHQDAPTTIENIASGRVIENVYQEIELAQVDDQFVFDPQVLGEMGEPSHGAADPAGIALTSTGERVIALSGVDELLFANSFGVNLDLTPVQDRPTQLLLSPDESRLYCLNELDESISVLDMATRSVTGTILLGRTPPESTRERGERLFFDANRSRFGWYSCHSCHVSGHSNGLLADTFSDGSAGAPKRILSLLGGRDNNPWAWNGSMRSLHDQVRKSGETTMRGDGFSARETNDVVAFLHTLDRPPTFCSPQTPEQAAHIERGRELFNRLGCARCHIPPLTYTSDATYDVGLSDERGQKKFNPPSLIGVGYRKSLFHDGRARSLREVVVEYGHQLNDAVSDEQIDDLIAFLESL